MAERPKHPSGKPRRDTGKKALGWHRPPLEGPLTPRLRFRDRAEVFGFTAARIGGDYGALDHATPGLAPFSIVDRPLVGPRGA